MKNMVTALLLMFLIASPAFAALKPGDRAPAFSLADIAGKEFSLSAAVGATGNKNGRGVVLSFFASWCIPCRNELPLINSLADELQSEGITAVLVDVKENAKAVKALLADLKVDKPVVVIDPDGKTAEQFGVRFLPVTFIIDAEGNVKDVIYGGLRDEQALRASVQKLLKK
jgi:cytochrome c biogenesis protein CcmG/thiol:disulfide interchange protein DsbE